MVGGEPTPNYSKPPPIPPLMIMRGVLLRNNMYALRALFFPVLCFMLRWVHRFTANGQLGRSRHSVD